MRRIRCACACLSLTLLLAAGLPSQDTCPALTVPKVIPGSNIFSDEQEMFLGDARRALRPLLWQGFPMPRTRRVNRLPFSSAPVAGRPPRRWLLSHSG
jgi:hypothetical protein